MHWTIPNTLTVVRLLAAPCLGMVFLVLARPWADWLAIALFVGASLTDYLDGIIARAWRQETAFGAMLDPIADKAMVVISIVVLIGLYGLTIWIAIPSIAILFREVFVSGLREHLGARAGTLKVTRLAKWKTFAQMIAITVLFAQGLFEHYFGMDSFGMDEDMIRAILAGEVADHMGLGWKLTGAVWSFYGGTALLWLAAALTLLTGWDYFRKALPFLREEESA